jgi:Flp pilus assembly pilin Flp
MKSLWHDEEGLTTVEYALLLALLVVAAVGVWTSFGKAVRNAVASSTNALTNSMTPS